MHCEFSGPFPDRTSLFCSPNLKSNAFTNGSLTSLLDLLLPPALPPHPLLLHHPAPPLPPLPLVHLGISALAFKSNCARVKGQKRVRNQSETSQKPVRNRPNAISLSLSLAYSLTLPSELFPDRFRTAQAYFASKFEIECVHAWILTPTTTTTPAATAPPLPLVHLGISTLAFKSNWHEFRWRARNESETSQKPVRNRSNATICFPLPPSLSLFLSFPPSPFLPLPCY